MARWSSADGQRIEEIDTGEVELVPPVYEPVPLIEIEKRHVAATLHATSWNKSRAELNVN